MAEIFILLILILLFISIKVEDGVIVLLTLLPFHGFIKNSLFFYFQQGILFSFWKEIAILILLSKLLYVRKKVYIDKNLFVFASFFVGLVIVYFGLANNLKPAIAPLRDHIFSILLLVLFSNFYFKIESSQKLVLWPAISFFVSYVLGFVQLFFLKIPMGYLMGRIEYITPGGNIIYTTTSARILGFERMAGFIGGPNGFGLFCAVSLLFIFIHRFTILNKLNSKRIRSFLTTTFFLGIISLIYSFSRAGWAVFFGGVLFILVALRKKIKWSLFLTPIFVVIMMLLFAPKDSPISKVFDKTFSGKEASSSARLSNISQGIKEILRAPWGHGLGTTNNQYPNLREYFVESATINMIYEFGFLGIILLFLIYFIIIIRSFIRGKNNPYAALGFTIAIVTILASFFSINTYGMPYILYSWAFMGLGLNKSINMQLNQ